jgi:hypothetical protein
MKTSSSAIFLPITCEISSPLTRIPIEVEHVDCHSSASLTQNKTKKVERVANLEQERSAYFGKL